MFLERLSESNESILHFLSTTFIFSLQLRYLELLKLRFGESHLHFCEIMLKDVADSRRINSHIQASAAKNEITKVHSVVPEDIRTPQAPQKVFFGSGPTLTSPPLLILSFKNFGF